MNDIKSDNDILPVRSVYSSSTSAEWIKIFEELLDICVHATIPLAAPVLKDLLGYILKELFTV